MRRSLLLVLAAAAVLDGCACDTVPEAAVTSCEVDRVFAGYVKTDILFVIDDSFSMDGEQTLLRDALAGFIDALVASPVQNDFQIGVTTTSVEDFGGGETYPNASPSPDGTPFPDGALLENDTTVVPATVSTWGDFLWTSNAAAADPGFYASGAQSRIMPYDSPTLADDFKRNVLVGTDGSGREQPLEAMRLALSTQLDPVTGENVGFLRPGARLAVIIITDEDDCSGPQSGAIGNSKDCRDEKVANPSLLTPVSDYVDFLEGPISGEDRDTVVAVIGGVEPGTLALSCAAGSQCGTPAAACCANNACATATDKADRLVALLSGLGRTRTRLASICDANFDQALSDFASVIMSQTVPLEGTPSDWRMLVVGVTLPDGTRVPCTVALEGSGSASAADAVYSPPASGLPARLTFQNACALDRGFKISIDVICAG